ncbi:transglycosylase domain-containing protein [Metabacillus idriensis]|uniref:transglycosylase domain-containing protein n=1 Tax=Metabacillus idriensis TaxID=324768 RepID=UPI00174AA6C2|nr:PBP1A family penicillin-binding protein [Metabacillus idriensis]
MEIITPRRLKITIKAVRAAIFIGLILFFLASAVLVTILLAAKWQGAPSLTVQQSSIMYANDGSELGKTHHGGKRYWVNLDEISPSLIEATVAIEDRHFYEHSGFDYKRIAGAALADLKAMAKVQGASTISQQYARNLFLVHDKTWKRKLTEAFYTIRLELNYSKEEILEGYLNTIYYGHGAYGIEAASNYYFGKSASDLSLSEASMLAGIPKAPGLYSPHENIERAKSRQALILKTMANQKVITHTEADQAYETQLTYRSVKNEQTADIAPYFQDAVMNELSKKLNLDQTTIETRGLRIFTTLDPDLQKMAEVKVADVIEESSDIQVGFMAMDPKTGYVKALIGGRDYAESTFNRVTQAKRQPGSTMKPFLYYAAVNKGFTPSTLLRSEPYTFKFEDGKSSYKPSNYNGYYANDTISLAQAIALSDNIYAVKTHLFLGMEELIETSKRFGVTSKLAHVPSLALGTSPVRLSEMVNGYGMLANGGKSIEPSYIKKVEDAEGNVIYQKEQEQEQILNKEAAFVTSHLMTGMFDEQLNDYTSVTGHAIIPKLSREYAGKSGTTKADSWMIGFAPQLVAGIWTGYDKDKTIDLVAERAYAKDIWAGFMEEALQDESVKAFTPPKGVIGVYINPKTGKLASDGCPVKRFAYFIRGTEPTEYCTEHLEHGKQLPAKEKQKHEKTWYKKVLRWWD